MSTTFPEGQRTYDELVEDARENGKSLFAVISGPDSSFWPNFLVGTVQTKVGEEPDPAEIARFYEAHDPQISLIVDH